MSAKNYKFYDSKSVINNIPWLFSHKFAKLIPNIGHGSVQKQMLEIILDYVTYKSNRLKDMFNYVPNIDGELQRFLDDEGNTDTVSRIF